MVMTWKRIEQVALVAIRLFVGGLFIAFAVAKLLESPEEFQIAINNYQMLPVAIVPAFAWAMVIAELVFGIGLVLGVYTKWSAAAIGLMLLSFIIAIGQAIARGLELPDCGCAGSIHIGDTPQQVLFRDILLLLGSVWVMVRARRMPFTIDSWLNHGNKKEQ